METADVIALAGFVAAVSSLLLLLELGMRKARRRASWSDAVNDESRGRHLSL